METPGPSDGFSIPVRFVVPSSFRRMAKLVFDIETSALPLENFDEAQQEYLFREARKNR